MAPQLSGDTPRRTREAQQEGREDPGRQRPLALVQQGSGEVIEGALAAMAPVALASGTVLVRAPTSNMVALAPRTLEWTIFPPECMWLGKEMISLSPPPRRTGRAGHLAPGSSNLRTPKGALML